MPLSEDNDSAVVLVASSLEVTALSNGLNEALEAIDDWEFETRVGISSSAARRLIEDLRRSGRHD